MSTTKTDPQIQKDVEEELRFDPSINSHQVGVTVVAGAATLRGTVDTFVERRVAEVATKRVSGVRSVVIELRVKLLPAHTFGDAEIAAAAEHALAWDATVPDGLLCGVERGHVTLEGAVESNFQREAALRAVGSVKGVVGLTCNVTIEPKTAALTDLVVKEKVQSALLRQAHSDAKSIQVATSGGTVTLSGKASSWRASADAIDAAWAAPGVTQVVDRMAVSF